MGELFADSEGLPFNMLAAVSETALLCGLLCAWGAWRIARRRVMSPRACRLWAVGVGSLGIFGLLMLLAPRFSRDGRRFYGALAFGSR